MNSKKIINREELKKILSKNRPKIVGFSSGAFDLLHPGHLDYLKKAKEQCDLLIVGLNTDNSIRNYKNEIRPIMPEDARAKILAALEIVDYVFLFDELNNNKNIEELRPNIYFKASDYSNKPLTSKPIIEAYGGKVVLIDIEEHFSSTDIINSILEKYTASKNEYIKAPDLPKSKAVILDRDGTINKPVSYLSNPEDFEFLEGAIEGLKNFQDKGYRLVIITNQPGIDFGYFKMEDLYKVNKKMLKILSQNTINIDKIYFSPYTKARDTDCRKPNTALIKRAERELNLDLSQSIVIGDSTCDILLGKRAGCKTILVQTGNAGKDELYSVTPDFIVSSLLEIANFKQFN